MNTLRNLSLAAIFVASFAGGAMAQSPDSVGPSAVGHWLHNQDGATIGSVRSLSGDGRTADIMIGSYFQQGSHEAQVPVSALKVIDGKVTLQNATVQALNTSNR